MPIRCGFWVLWTIHVPRVKQANLRARVYCQKCSVHPTVDVKTMHNSACVEVSYHALKPLTYHDETGT